MGVTGRRAARAGLLQAAHRRKPDVIAFEIDELVLTGFSRIGAAAIRDDIAAALAPQFEGLEVRNSLAAGYEVLDAATADGRIHAAAPSTTVGLAVAAAIRGVLGGIVTPGATGDQGHHR